MTAAEAVASSILTPRDLNVFVSINQDEAREKIRYAKLVMEALDAHVRPALTIDNSFELEFDNGSRLVSHPCRPVRGKPRANIYLDEFAHYAKDKDIYKSALPAATRGGRIRIGSSPLGAKGVFWEIFSQRMRPYPGYVRDLAPWWVVKALCNDLPAARQLAPGMATNERMERFGTVRIREIYDNLHLEDFQQEYECAFIDESTAWITWEEIKLNQAQDQSGEFLCWRAKNVDEAFVAIDQVAGAIRNRKIEGALAGGMDVGRRRDLSEIFFVGKTTTGQMPLRLMISLGTTPFESQKAVADACLERLPVTQMLIDQNGLGMQIAEQLMARHRSRVQGVDFTNASKELWAVELKVQMQRGNAPIPADRDLAYQLHSIKKTTTAAKNSVFDTSAGETHHADKFWALALALWAARAAQPADKTVSAKPSVKKMTNF